MTYQLRKVWIIEKTGTFNNLKIKEDGLEPPPPDYLRVKVSCCGLNFADMFAVVGLYSATPKGTFTPGLEFSGVVEHVGKGLKEEEWLGKRVYGVTYFGGYATYINAKSSYVKKTPKGWTDQQACAYVVQGLTVFYALEELGRLKPNQAVLVHSAAGGCGMLALSMLNKRSAKVVGTVGMPSKLDLLNEKYGENPNFNFILRDPAKDFEARAKKALSQITSKNEEFFDIVLDSVMGDWFWPNYNLLNREGRLVIYGSASYTPTDNLHPIWNMFQWLRLGWKYLWRPKVDPLKLVGDNKSLLGFNLIYLYGNEERLGQIFDRLQELELDPPYVGHEFDFDDAVEALTLMRSGKSVGKIVLNAAVPAGLADMSPRKTVQQKLTDVLSTSKKHKKNFKVAAKGATGEGTAVDEKRYEAANESLNESEGTGDEIAFTHEFDQQIITLEKGVSRDELTADAILQQFDLEYKYGPCLGVRRLDRWERAHKLGLSPPIKIRELLTEYPSLNEKNFLEDFLGDTLDSKKIHIVEH
ncbi:17866_t:CDS:2 [Acaulospora morrowiae]|uniref:17866_t:CDS:1 n=1 Tax=Acaulospora morrowiae TaxID=94023 RepID=A0A9N8V502_9GLOM|nr:17866_t:CDS:2 [Acaulospora morrowiae]